MSSESRAAPKTVPSLDVVLLLFLVIPYYLQFEDFLLSPITLLVGLYLIVHWVSPAPPWRARLKAAAVLAIVGLTTLTLMAVAIQVRVNAAPGDYSFVTSQTIHDGALQTEEAAKLFLSGRNPYEADFSDTPVTLYPLDHEGISETTHHYPYLPVTFLLTAPVLSISSATLGWFDVRIVYGAAFLLVLLLVPEMASREEKRLALLLTLGMNPLLTGVVPVGIATGANDYLTLALLMLSMALLRRGRRRMAAGFVALACATKPTAWFVLPFLLVLLARGQGLRGYLRSLRGPLTVFALVSAAIVLPFLLWNPGAFLDDTVRFAGGTSTVPYPIKGLGLSKFLLEIGVITSSFDPYPLWIGQILVTGGVSWWLLRRQRAWNTVSQAWLGYGVLLLAFVFTSRFLNPNYLGFVLALLALGTWSDPDLIRPDKP